MKKSKSNRGGSRPGSGRKAGPETTTISFRVKTEYAEPLKKIVKEKIIELDGYLGKL